MLVTKTLVLDLRKDEASPQSSSQDIDLLSHIQIPKKINVASATVKPGISRKSFFKAWKKPTVTLKLKE